MSGSNDVYINGNNQFADLNVRNLYANNNIIVNSSNGDTGSVSVDSSGKMYLNDTGYRSNLTNGYLVADGSGNLSKNFSNNYRLCWNIRNNYGHIWIFSKYLL